MTGKATFGFDLPHEHEEDKVEIIRKRIQENIGAIQGSEYAKNLLKKFRSRRKKPISGKAAIMGAQLATAMIFDLFGINIDPVAAMRLFGSKFADMLGEEGEEEYEWYIDPETGEPMKRRKRKPFPRLEIIKDKKTKKMYVIAESGEKLELYEEGETKKLMFRTNSGNVFEVPENMEIWEDPMTGKLWLQEKRNLGMEVFVDEDGRMFFRTKDGKLMEIIKDPITGKIYLRTESGTLKEMPGNMEVYVDPLTGKLYFGEKPPAPSMEVFFDEKTGKQYIRTEDGQLLEVVVGEDGKIYLRTQSGTFRELPPGMQLYTDPATGKLIIGTAPPPEDPRTEVIFDPITGKQYIKTASGKLLELVQGADGKMYLRTESGNLRDLPPGVEVYKDPLTGKMYVGKPPPTNDFVAEVFVDPVTGKQYIRTQSGNIMELVQGADGKTYLRTKSGNLRELPDDMMLYIDPVTGKSYIGKKATDQGSELIYDPKTGKTYMRMADGKLMEVVFDEATGKRYLRSESGTLTELKDMEIYTDPVTGKTYLRLTFKNFMHFKNQETIPKNCSVLLNIELDTNRTFLEISYWY